MDDLAAQQVTGQHKKQWHTHPSKTHINRGVKYRTRECGRSDGIGSCWKKLMPVEYQDRSGCYTSEGMKRRFKAHGSRVKTKGLTPAVAGHARR
jgi:hypothetical protein